MRVAKYNVNGVNGRLSRLLDWLRETNPDIACLQELKTDDTKFPARALEAAAYGAFWHGKKPRNRTTPAARSKPPGRQAPPSK